MTDAIIRADAVKVVEEVRAIVAGMVKEAGYAQEAIDGIDGIYGVICDRLQKLPAVELRTELHARWKVTYGGVPQKMVCSHCNISIPRCFGYNYVYCPKCGARMDAKGE